MLYLSFGSNLGHSLNLFRQAIERIETKGLMTGIGSSMVLLTDAILPEGTPASWDRPYYNMVIKGHTEHTPELLLKALQVIEIELGRPKTHEHWGPRCIDIDILWWEGIERESETLCIPHAELFNRDFFIHLLKSIDCPLPERFAYDTYEVQQSFELYPKIVGIVNVTADSFSDGGQFLNPEAATAQCKALISAGASVVELGAQSTRPNAPLITAEEETTRLVSVLKCLYESEEIEMDRIDVSIDTYRPEVLSALLDSSYPFKILNDVSGRLIKQVSKEVIDQLIEKDIQICSMHALSVPVDPTETLDIQTNPTDELLEWTNAHLGELKQMGFKAKNIILDLGIGFGKNPWQSIDLLKNLSAFKEALPCEWLLGHSRKSFMQAFSQRDAKDRDIESIAIGLAVKDQVDYLRVHNVEGLQRALIAQSVLNPPKHRLN